MIMRQNRQRGGVSRLGLESGQSIAARAAVACKKFWALLVSMAMLVSMAVISGVNAAPAMAADGKTKAAGDQISKVVDGDTMTSWSGHATKSTQNIGRIWTDKTVTQSSVSLGHLDGQQTTTVDIGDSDFLVALSALSSASNTATTSNTPLDIVLVLDRSGSMKYQFDGT